MQDVVVRSSGLRVPEIIFRFGDEETTNEAPTKNNI